MKNIIYIKNMVCQRCIISVENIFKKLNIPYTFIKLGEVQFDTEQKHINFKELEKELKAVGFELISDKKNKIINQIKEEIINYIHYTPDFKRKLNFSDYLVKKTGHGYSYLSKLFSSVESQTIEKYIILQKIEKVKELLSYKELSLSEISYELEYSSVQHLSSQFKKITGFTPTEFKKSNVNIRKSLDKL